MEAVAEIAEYGRDARRSFHLGHVARLARLRAVRLAVVAMLPFLEVHLLRQRTNYLPGGGERLCVQRMARGAQFGLLNVGTLCLHEAGDGTHDRFAAGIDLIRTK